MSFQFDKVSNLSPAEELRELLSIPLLSIVAVATPSGLNRLSRLLKNSPPHAFTVDMLTVRLRSLPNRQALSDVLRLCINVNTLTIILPSNFNIETLLSESPLPRLDALETNISHAAVAAFLGLHPNTTVLTLGPCNRRPPCPISAIPLPCLEHLICPLECVPAFSSSPSLRTFSATYIGGIDPPVSSSSIVRTITHGTNITRIFLEFSPTDYDMLRQLAIAAPNLEILKLVEKADTKSSRREWNNWIAWSRDLYDLSRLKKLILRTAISPVRTPGSKIYERKMVERWGRWRNNAHPSLYDIWVWYLSGDDKGVMSKWRRSGQSWARSQHVSVPASSVDLLDDSMFNV
ncbi:hypothetical protein PLICRDRAFT_170676 [Plicaturopsis crispa FD-325 SS-3]|nr:hypothetical protein PLICRDRAFT_170676 [Plicaturopsis crispa FD-325 SS-3]